MIILSSVYRFLIQKTEQVLAPKTLKAIKWEHPAGPKTIHFWAPFAKWVLGILRIIILKQFLFDFFSLKTF